MEMVPNNKLLDLTGKVAIVTGGAMGIGLGIVNRLAEAGAKVVVADLNLASAEKVAGELVDNGKTAKAVAVDVAKEADVEKMVVDTVAEFGGLDIIVNNAGIYPNVPLASLTLDEFDKILSVNLKGLFLCVKKASNQMISQARGGHIINITSIDAIHPSMVGLASYDASKHGAWGFTKNVAIELAPHKIWVNAIAPGGISTPGVQGMQKGQPKFASADMQKMIEAFMARIPMHRMGEPDEIGKVALFLASDMSSYMTGSQIVVDGGALLM